jgi:hypothetical protein
MIYLNATRAVYQADSELVKVCICHALGRYCTKRYRTRYKIKFIVESDVKARIRKYDAGYPPYSE